MKNIFCRRLALLLAAVLLFSALTGCAGEEPEKRAGISFDNIVCRYICDPPNVEYGDRGTVRYTIYADNTVILEKAPHGNWKYDWNYERTITITEEQKQSIIDAVRENRLWRVGDCSNSRVPGSSYQYIILFDENGKEISKNGGCDPTNRHFRNVEYIIDDILDIWEEIYG